jgi:hypothetical protein
MQAGGLQSVCVKERSSCYSLQNAADDDDDEEEAAAADDGVFFVRFRRVLRFSSLAFHFLFLFQW